MMRYHSLMMIFLLIVCLTGLGPAQADSHMKAAEEVIAVTKAQWAAEMKKDSAAASKAIADDYTEFNGTFATRLEGKAINMRLSEAAATGSGQLIAAEMTNEHVQVYGNVAILSYNFVGYTKSEKGEIEPVRAKSTRVYVNQGGNWMLVHANFGSDPSND